MRIRTLIVGISAGILATLAVQALRSPSAPASTSVTIDMPPAPAATQPAVAKKSQDNLPAIADVALLGKLTQDGGKWRSADGSCDNFVTYKVDEDKGLLVSTTKVDMGYGLQNRHVKHRIVKDEGGGFIAKFVSDTANFASTSPLEFKIDGDNLTVTTLEKLNRETGKKEPIREETHLVRCKPSGADGPG